MIYLPYRRHLEVIRAELERELPHFPRAQCMDSSYIASLLLPLEVRAGEFVDKVIGLTHAHVWNHDPFRRIDICLSLDQFSSSLEDISKITILPAGNGRLIEDEKIRNVVERLGPDKDREYRAELVEIAQKISKKLPPYPIPLPPLPTL
jgi:hypothetical protein